MEYGNFARAKEIVEELKELEEKKEALIELNNDLDIRVIGIGFSVVLLSEDDFSNIQEYIRTEIVKNINTQIELFLKELKTL